MTNDCPLCMDHMGPDNTIAFPCGSHLACFRCYDKLMETTKKCPWCNHTLHYGDDAEDAIPLDGADEDAAADEEEAEPEEDEDVRLAAPPPPPPPVPRRPSRPTRPLRRVHMTATTARFVPPPHVRNAEDLSRALRGLRIAPLHPFQVPITEPVRRRSRQARRNRGNSSLPPAHYHNQVLEV